jgi:DNA (cytosine-5)-methyltransferase 1
MKIGSLFSGIGLLEMGLEWSGVGTVVWQAEANEFCQKVLAKRYPNVKRYDDVRKITKDTAEDVDLLCGGFPCQDLSVAGKQAGLEGERSGLWWEFHRIVGELRPRWVVIENVYAGWAKWLPTVRKSLHELGYTSMPIRVQASNFGAPHRRSRVIIVAYSNSVPIRNEPWWWPGEGGEDPAELGDDGETQSLALPSGPPQYNVQRLPTGENVSVRHADDPRCSEQWGTGPISEELITPQCSSWWGTEPNVGRVVDGGSNRVDRLRALGNAVVPHCTKFIGQLIIKAELENK